jgi:hypothetical protein
VMDTLPVDLSFVSASGAGWNCAFTTKITCTYDGSSRSRCTCRWRRWRPC